MRYIMTIATTLFIALPAWAFDMPKGFVEIGKYTIEVNGEPIELFSVSSEQTEFSDLHFDDYQDETGQIVRGYTIQATNGFNEHEDNEPPILQVGFDLMPDADDLVPTRIILVDQSWDTPLAADPDYIGGTLQVSNLVFDTNGVISFDFSAVMVRIDMQTYTPIPEAAGATVQGSYSGTFPEFALKYPYVAGDY